MQRESKEKHVCFKYEYLYTLGASRKLFYELAMREKFYLMTVEDARYDSTFSIINKYLKKNYDVTHLMISSDNRYLIGPGIHLLYKSSDHTSIGIYVEREAKDSYFMIIGHASKSEIIDFISKCSADIKNGNPDHSHPAFNAGEYSYHHC